MANLTHREPHRSNGATAPPRNALSDDTPRDGLLAGSDDDDLRAEMTRLAAANAEIMNAIRARHESRDQLNQLRAENAELRKRLQELELREPQDAPQEWEQQQREYEALLEEKSEVIRALHQKIQDLQEQAPAPAPASLDGAELEELARQLEEERQRVQEDEEALMAQMREMEMSMSRERAEMSRQRAEIQRLYAELNREVEHAGRDSGLRDRLQGLNRPKIQAALPQPAAAEPTPPPQKQGSGFFRRIFGG